MLRLVARQILSFYASRSIQRSFVRIGRSTCICRNNKKYSTGLDKLASRVNVQRCRWSGFKSRRLEPKFKLCPTEPTVWLYHWADVDFRGLHGRAIRRDCKRVRHHSRQDSIRSLLTLTSPFFRYNIKGSH